ncbi:hypothetical protein SAMN05216328_14117 [Ensifer sp. YR511]|nr:hypothetical protein SAMN05216328_14117 [Ensifer sp. YR511]
MLRPCGVVEIRRKNLGSRREPSRANGAFVHPMTKDDWPGVPLACKAACVRRSPQSRVGERCSSHLSGEFLRSSSEARMKSVFENGAAPSPAGAGDGAVRAALRILKLSISFCAANRSSSTVSTGIPLMSWRTEPGFATGRRYHFEWRDRRASAPRRSIASFKTRKIVTGRLLPRRFRLDADDEILVIEKAVEVVVPGFRRTASSGEHLTRARN